MTPAARIRDLYQGATAGPSYDPDDGDRRHIEMVGLAFPARATAALLLATVLVLADYMRIFIPAEVQALGRDPAAIRIQAVERAVLFGLVPLLVVVLGFGDRPARYGLRVGDWRWGIGLLLAGLAVMTPVILGLARLPAFEGYYGATVASLAERLATNVLELVPAEFLLRGFLMFALLRRIGPLALIVVQVPFVFAHIGKPELELWSTFVGGFVFAWLDWRTGSILWSALGHVYVLTLMMVATGGIA